MKFPYSVPSLLAFLLVSVLAQAQFIDDFSDGNFDLDPTWSGDDSLFHVENEVLLSNRDGALVYGLSTPSGLVDDAQWQFWVNLNFSTSGANYVDVYLMADNADLHAVQNGYFVRLGGTPDEISLYAMVGGVETIIVDGPDGQTGSSSNNIFTIRATRTTAGAWNLEADQGATGVFTTIGSANDLQTSSATHFGILITQSDAAGPVGNHFFDDFSVGPIPVDDIPPTLLSAEALSSTEVSLTFDEALEETSAQDPVHYDVTGIGQPTSVQWSAANPAQTTLILGSPLLSGQTYTVTATGVSDPSGNVSPGTSANFFFYTLGNPTFKSLVFNELMADPTPTVGLPEAEYIELFNADTAFFDLDGWILVNTTTEKTLGALLLPPGGYAILCNATDTALFSGYGSVLGIPSFTALTNSADSLTLLDPDGSLVDVVSYTDDWYKDPESDDGGHSLELVNPYTPCSGEDNWRASTAAIGGTPGSENSVFDDTPDTSPPDLLGYYLPANDQVNLTFSEPLDEASTAAAVYVIEPDIGVSAATLASPNTIALQLDAAFATGVEYTLTVSGVADCEGNFLDEPLVITILVGDTPGLSDVLITEIMADPSPSVGLPEGEYFELYNATDHTVELGGSTLSGLVFPEPTLLAPGEYAAFASDQNTLTFLTVPGVRFLQDMSTTYLTNGGRELLLSNPDGERVDRVEYSLDSYGDPTKEDGGYSLERINLAEPCRGQDNWTASTAALGGTPGEVNSVNDTLPDTKPPVLQNIYVRSEGLVELVFSEVIDSMATLTAEIETAPALPVAAVENKAPAYRSLLVQWGEPLEPDTIYTLSISGVADCTGNLMQPVAMEPFALPEPAEPGDLLLNELLYNPRTGGSDFVEIVNVSDKAISLKGMKLQNASMTTKTITEAPEILFPGGYAALTPDPDNLIAEYPLGRERNFVRVEALPSFPNSSGSVILTDSLGGEFDRFDYSDSYQFPLLVTDKGVSLERLSFTRPTNDPGNWASASEQVGFATPGYQNSQYLPEGVATAEFSLQKDVFSPDNDGFEDVLYLNYRMDGPGYVATVRVYDRNGRAIRTLANNLLLGTEGTLSWDGITDDRTKARIGPHIIFVETYGSDGQTASFKIPCIVAGRLSQ